jgi:hypothetical protein
MVKPASLFCHTDEQGETRVLLRLKVTNLVTWNGFTLGI